MAKKEIKGRIQHKRDTDANWKLKNAVLLNGEIIIVEMDDGSIRQKIGDGVKTYTQLPFYDEPLYKAVAEIKQNLGFISAVDFTLPASGWISGQQTISIAEVKTDQHGVVGLSQTITDAQYKATVAAAMYVSAQGNGTITVSCKGDVLQIDIPAVIILFS